MKLIHLPGRAIATGLLAAAGVGLFGVTVAFATGPGDQVCQGLDSGKIDTTGDPMSVTLTAPDGFLIDSYCVKAASSTNGGGPQYFSFVEDPRLPAVSITITYTDAYGKAKAISHYSYTWIPKEDTSSSTTTPATSLTTSSTAPPSTTSQPSSPSTTTTVPTTATSTTSRPTTSAPSTTVPPKTTPPTAKPSRPSASSSTPPTAPSSDVTTPPNSPRLANTGAEATEGTLLALALVGAGGGAWVLARRTRQH